MKIKRVQRYRKKPVIIEAIHWTEDIDIAEIQEFIGDHGEVKITNPFATELCYYCVIHTLEGDMKAHKGDYIIKGISGEFYPYKPDIFEKIYEKVEE